MATPRRDIFKMLDGFTNRRGLGYARYSSDMQKDGWTIQAQVRTITDHLAAKGIPIEAICKDEAKSAKTTERAGLQEALALIREGRPNMLVVAKLDRATRALFDAPGLDRELKQYGASLYCIEENIDTSDPQSTFLFQIHAIMAQRYRENLAFETAKGKRERVEDGLANGDPPYGYRRATEADLLDFAGDAEALVTALRRQPYIPIPERAAAVRLAFELGATGCYSDTEIAEELNRRGHRMVSKRQPAGGPFKKDTIGAILRDPFYCGRVSYDGLKVHGRLDLKLRRCHGKTLDKPGKHDPFISQELFDRMQAVRARRRRGAGGRAPVQERVYIAAKLARCTVCEETLRANAARDKAIYRAAHRERGIPSTATRGRIDATLVHDYLAGFIASITLPPSWHAFAMEAVRDDETARHQERERTALQAKLARLKELVKEGIIEPDEYRADKARIDAQLTALQHETTSIDLERAAAQLANLTALWAEATDEERRAIVLGVVEAVWVDLDGNRVEAVQPKAWFYPLRAAFPATWAFCGTDEIRVRVTYTCQRPALRTVSLSATMRSRVRRFGEHRTAHTIRRQQQQSEMAQQVATMRVAGKTWAEVTAVMGLASSRVRAIYASATPSVPGRFDDGAILANLRDFLTAHTHVPSRRKYGAWDRRIVSPATVENRFGSWRDALLQAQEATADAS